MTVTRLADLEGDWVLTRVIDDARTGEAGYLDGQAAFTADGPAWRYRETGTLRLADRAPLQATREFLFTETDTGVDVRFGDGRPFHSFEWSRPEARHDCAPDLYKVRYDFAAWPRWQAIWQVSGPRKAYTMTSSYSRP